MTDYKYCQCCGDRTGMAGADDYSIYYGELGPLCEECADLCYQLVRALAKEMQNRTCREYMLSIAREMGINVEEKT